MHRQEIFLCPNFYPENSSIFAWKLTILSILVQQIEALSEKSAVKNKCAFLIQLISRKPVDVNFFLKQRIDLIRHFYDAASEPFVRTKNNISAGLAPFDAPPYDESGEPPFLVEWLQADVEHELVGRAAVSMLSEALKQFFVTWERRTLGERSCEDCFKKEFRSGFISGYSACFGKAFNIDWKSCPADLDVLKQVVLARNRAQHPDLVMDHLTHDAKALSVYPKPFFARPEEEGDDASQAAFLSATIEITRDNLFTALEQAESLGTWVQHQIELHFASERKQSRGLE